MLYNEKFKVRRKAKFIKWWIVLKPKCLTQMKCSWYGPGIYGIRPMQALKSSVIDRNDKQVIMEQFKHIKIQTRHIAVERELLMRGTRWCSTEWRPE